MRQEPLLIVKSNKTDQGFSLIEVLVALLLMTLVLMTLMQVAVLTMKLNLSNKLRDTAIAITDDELNRLRSIEFTNLPPATDPPTVITQDITRKIGLIDFPFTVATTVRKPIGSGGTADENWRTVQVLTTWKTVEAKAGTASDKSLTHSHTATVVLKRLR